jgi:transcriptional regulator
MYRPAHFRDDDAARLHDFIEARGFGLLISAGPDGPVADPLPFVLDRAGEKGVLRGHLARANPHLGLLRAAPRALVVFSGLDGYISPGFYPSKREAGRVVPTWNYEIVQARGTVRLVEDARWLEELVAALTARHEAGRAESWALTDAPRDFIDAQIRAIVGVEIVIETLEGKSKMSQNRSAADRAGVAEGLRREGAEALAQRVEAGGFEKRPI